MLYFTFQGNTYVIASSRSVRVDLIKQAIAHLLNDYEPLNSLEYE